MTRFCSPGLSSPPHKPLPSTALREEKRREEEGISKNGIKIPKGSLLAYLLESGIFVNFFRREMAPKDLCLYPDEVIVTDGSREFAEYTTLR